MSAFPIYGNVIFDAVNYTIVTTDSTKTLSYYGFPGFNIPDPADDPPKPKPTTCLEVLKQHEENVEKALEAMPKIEKLIIYSVLNRQGTRMDNIDREIYKEAQKELKANG